MMQPNSKQARHARRAGHACHWLAAVALGIAAMLGTTAARAEPLLHVEAGLLTGASGVLVNGTAYDVTFSDGTCNSLQMNCTQFTFNNAADAAAASQALLDQVFTGVYDSTPNLTRGCTIASSCLVSTIYGPDPSGPTDYNVATATNSALEAGDGVAQGVLLLGDLQVHGVLRCGLGPARLERVLLPLRVDRAAGAVDVEVDVFVRVFGVQQQHLRADRVGVLVAHLRTQKDDSVGQQRLVDRIVDTGQAGAGRGAQRCSVRQWQGSHLVHDAEPIQPG